MIGTHYYNYENILYNIFSSRLPNLDYRWQLTCMIIPSMHITTMHTNWITTVVTLLVSKK